MSVVLEFLHRKESATYQFQKFLYRYPVGDRWRSELINTARRHRRRLWAFGQVPFVYKKKSYNVRYSLL